MIIATGASAKWLGLPSEEKLNGYGVSACAVCDGFFFRGKEVAIVGAGDTAAEEALYLSKLCTNVHMFIRRDQMRASQIMQQRIREASNIKIYWNTVVEEILGDTKVDGVRIKNTSTGKVETIPVHGFFVAIGHEPNSAIFKEWLDMDETGYIKTIPGSTRTNIEGVYAAGDVQDRIYRQAVTAAGSGCMAALDAERWLSLRAQSVKLSVKMREAYVEDLEIDMKQYFQLYSNLSHFTFQILKKNYDYNRTAEPDFL